MLGSFVTRILQACKKRSAKDAHSPVGRISKGGGSIKGKAIVRVLAVLMIMSFTSCGARSLPDYAPDIVCTVYHNMNSDRTYEIHGKLSLTMKFAEKESLYTVERSVVSSEDPYEVVVKTDKVDGGKNLGTEYQYFNEKLDKEHSYLLVKECWIRQEKEAMDSYWTVVPFCSYFTNVASFEELAESKGVTVVQGETAGEQTEYALQESGVLERFTLTGLSEETAAKLPGIKVKAWVEERQGIITKVEADMTEAVRSMVGELYGEHGPQIISCSYEIDKIELDNVQKMSVHFDTKTVGQE